METNNNILTVRHSIEYEHTTITFRFINENKHDVVMCHADRWVTFVTQYSIIHIIPYNGNIIVFTILID